MSRSSREQASLLRAAARGIEPTDPERAKLIRAGARIIERGVPNAWNAPRCGNPNGRPGSRRDARGRFA